MAGSKPARWGAAFRPVLNMDPLALIQRDLLRQAVVELRRAGRFMPGNPRRRLQRAPPAVYPRVYGGTANVGHDHMKVRGLSPRVQGNRQTPLHPECLERSIPVCTGEPAAQLRTARGWAVYPRVYGGTANGRPRPYEGQRSIPACTGEPRTEYETLAAHTVYPRVYGGTSFWMVRLMVALGLSPRVRGNLCGVDIHRTIQRSIPACTGEPSGGQPDLHPVPQGLSPRVRGNRNMLLKLRAGLNGLSPRVQGNHSAKLRQPGLWRSIPACTGEPLLSLLDFLPP